MIVDTGMLPGLAGQVTMVDGGFDPIHHGHVAYLRAAAALGLPVLCNVAPDHWVARKHPVLLAQAHRGVVLDAMRDVTYVHLASGTTAEVLQALRPAIYAKGDDWSGRLPEEEQRLCLDLGIDVRFLPTVVDSSTELLARFAQGTG